MKFLVSEILFCICRNRRSGWFVWFVNRGVLRTMWFLEYWQSLRNCFKFFIKNKKKKWVGYISWAFQYSRTRRVNLILTDPIALIPNKILNRDFSAFIFQMTIFMLFAALALVMADHEHGGQNSNHGGRDSHHGGQESHHGGQENHHGGQESHQGGNHQSGSHGHGY